MGLLDVCGVDVEERGAFRVRVLSRVMVKEHQSCLSNVAKIAFYELHTVP